MFETLLNLLFPPVCPVCGGRIGQAGALCADCYAKLIFYKGSTSAAASAVVYGDISKQLLLALKYADAAHLAPMLGKMTARAGQSVLSGADVLVSVPLHRRRLFVRKYNQAALLANAVAAESGVRHDPFVLKRVKMTGKQSDRSKRFENVRKAFEFNKGDIKGKVVVVVDDVTTTGATFNACAAMLRAAGAKEVRLLTFAKAVRD